MKVLGFGGSLVKGEAGAQLKQMEPKQANPPGDDRDMGVCLGYQRGGITVKGNGGRCRHAWQGADISGGG